MDYKKYKRVFTIVIDSLGAGDAVDAAAFGDAGTDTLGHIAESVGNLHIPNLQKLGIFAGKVIFITGKTRYVQESVISF